MTTRDDRWTRSARAAGSAAFSVAAFLSAAAGAGADPAVPSADQLNQELAVILDTGAPAAQRASYLEGGSAALPVADTVAGPIAEHRSMVSLKVESPSREGDHVATRLVMSVMGMGSDRRGLEWVDKGGAWKLSNGSLCEIYALITKGGGCPL